MKQVDQNRLSMWRAVRQHLDAHTSIWNTNAAFNRASAALTAAIDNAKSALDRQAIQSVGFSGDREVLEATAIQSVTAIARCAKVYAMERGSNELLNVLDYSRTSLQRLPQNELAAQLRSMVNACQSAGAALAEYGVAEDACEGALERIARMEAAQSSVRRAITLRKAVTKGVDSIMASGRVALAKMDNLIHLFDNAAPDFTSGYRTVRGVVHVGLRHKDAEPDG